MHSMMRGSIRVTDNMCRSCVRLISVCSSTEIDSVGSTWWKVHCRMDWRMRSKPNLLASEALTLSVICRFRRIRSPSPTTSPFNLILRLRLPLNFHHEIGWPLNWDEYPRYLLKFLLNTPNRLLALSANLIVKGLLRGFLSFEVLKFEGVIFSKLKNTFYRDWTL